MSITDLRFNVYLAWWHADNIPEYICIPDVLQSGDTYVTSPSGLEYTIISVAVKNAPSGRELDDKLMSLQESLYEAQDAMME